MGEWKAYQTWSISMNRMVYKVGRKRDLNKPVDENNIEWNGFYSLNPQEAKEYANELNRKEQG